LLENGQINGGLLINKRKTLDKLVKIDVVDYICRSWVLGFSFLRLVRSRVLAFFFAQY
jgi:hypothetical protein